MFVRFNVQLFLRISTTTLAVTDPARLRALQPSLGIQHYVSPWRSTKSGQIADEYELLEADSEVIFSRAQLGD